MTFAHALLIGSSLFFLVVFTLPLLLATNAWARAFQWPVAQQSSPLALYFGRCLGAVATALMLIMLRYAGSPAHQPLLLELIGLGSFILTAVHVWGAVEGSQPWTEDAEILLYGGATALALYARWTL